MLYPETNYVSKTWKTSLSKNALIREVLALKLYEAKSNATDDLYKPITSNLIEICPTVSRIEQTSQYLSCIHSFHALL
jgi:hypothetical protein